MDRCAKGRSEDLARAAECPRYKIVQGGGIDWAHGTGTFFRFRVLKGQGRGSKAISLASSTDNHSRTVVWEIPATVPRAAVLGIRSILPAAKLLAVSSSDRSHMPVCLGPSLRANSVGRRLPVWHRVAVPTCCGRGTSTNGYGRYSEFGSGFIAPRLAVQNLQSWNTTEGPTMKRSD